MKKTDCETLKLNKGEMNVIEKYGFKDMYSAGFYLFKTEEEKWACWSRKKRN